MSNYSLNELMSVAVSRELHDGEIAFIGVGTSGRAFTLACGIPLVAARLAQKTHAPTFTVYWGNHLSPDLSEMPEKLTQDNITRWKAAACPPTISDKIDMLTRGRFDISFDSAPQIDRYGNLNITAIGEYNNPTVRLVGCLAQPEHLAFAKRPIIVTDLSKKSFVEKVDFITSVGYLEGSTSRLEAGLENGGPWCVVTDKAVFDFRSESKGMRIQSIHPGESIKSVLDSMSFEPIIPDDIPTTVPPSQKELELIRLSIDPNKVFLKD
jgi:glutaconate CoA-transferase subunit B